MSIGQAMDALLGRIARTWVCPSWFNLLVTLPWAIGVGFLLYSSKADRVIAARQLTQYGLVTLHDPGNHDRYDYQFSVNGRSYAGSETPVKTEFRSGQRVRVYYDPMDPSINALTDFNEIGKRVLDPVPLLMVGILAVAIIIFIRRYQTSFSRMVAD